VDALLFLLLSAALLALAERWPGASLVAVPVAALAGTTLPDLDLALGLGHRSGLTHSVLPVAVAAIRPRWWPVAAGLALGIGLHLSADCFPNAMRGYATVKLPVVRSIGAGWSYGWLAANAVACLSVGAWLVRREASVRATLMVLAAVAVVGIAYLWATDGGWPALAVFTGTGWVLVRRRRA
jgi:hypothetical protein